jgi:hypothetical protein
MVPELSRPLLSVKETEFSPEIRKNRNRNQSWFGKEDPFTLWFEFKWQSGNVITQVQLKGENYDECSRAIKTSLRARRKWGFIEGTITQPKKGSSDLENCWTVQSMLVSWVMNTVEPSLRSTISNQENVKDLWEDIKERFSIGNGPRVQQIKEELGECRQTKMTMVAYYGKLKTMWDELANYQRTPYCTCG